MKIVVCVKQVPDTNEVKINPETGTLIRDGVPSILNPDDANALEEALCLKAAEKDSKVIVLSMGPPQAGFMLRECLAMGADEAILLSDAAFGGSDTWATSNVLAKAIAKIGSVDVVFTGRQAIDGDTAQVGPQIAERLNLPQVTYVQELTFTNGTFTVKRQLEDGYEIIEVKPPVLFSAVKELNCPRHMSIGGIFEAYEKAITTWKMPDLDIDRDLVGLKASPTRVYRSFPAQLKRDGILWEDSCQVMVDKLFKELKAEHFL